MSDMIGTVEGLEVVVKRTPWFAVRDFGDGESLAVIHWKGAAVIIAALMLGAGGLLGGWFLLGQDGGALALGVGVWLVSLVALFLAIRPRIVDERDRP